MNSPLIDRLSPEADEVFPHSYPFGNGHLHPADRAGLGVDYDEKLGAGSPYQRAYLPINRKLDGRMFDW
jgi:mannonate dehydratase